MTEARVWDGRPPNPERDGFPCPPPAAPCADEVDQIARWLADNRKLDGRTYYALAQELLSALSPLRQAERERAWREGAEAMRRNLFDAADDGEWYDADELLAVLRKVPSPPAQALAEAMRALPLPPMGGV